MELGEISEAYEHGQIYDQVAGWMVVEGGKAARGRGETMPRFCFEQECGDGDASHQVGNPGARVPFRKDGASWQEHARVEVPRAAGTM